MRKVSMILSLLMLAISLTGYASAETIQIGSGTTVIGTDEYTMLDDMLEVRPHSANVIEKLGEYGEDSGDNHQFVYIDIDVCNVSFENVDLSTYFTAELTYAERYTFNPYQGTIVSGFFDSLIGKWEGEYRKEPERRTCSLEITSIDSQGKVQGVWTFGPLDQSTQPIGSYSVTGIINESIGSISLKGLQWIIDPGNYRFNDSFYLRLIDDKWLFGTADSLPIYMSRTDSIARQNTMLGVLEEIQYPLIFLVPNRVASDLDNCKVEIIVNGNHYQIDLK